MVKPKTDNGKINEYSITQEQKTYVCLGECKLRDCCGRCSCCSDWGNQGFEVDSCNHTTWKPYD